MVQVRVHVIELNLLQLLLCLFDRRNFFFGGASASGLAFRFLGILRLLDYHCCFQITTTKQQLLKLDDKCLCYKSCLTVKQVFCTKLTLCRQTPVHQTTVLLSKPRVDYHRLLDYYRTV